MTRVAFFISPTGDIIHVPLNHISAVIGDAKTFGLRKEEIQEAYDKHGEQIGVEGETRTELLLRIIDTDWIRIRRYRNFYSVTAKDLSSAVFERIQDWARKMLSGVSGFRETDLHMPVRISTPDAQVVFSIRDIAQGHMIRLEGTR
jgi:hypothetical protein